MKVTCFLAGWHQYDLPLRELLAFTQGNLGPGSQDSLHKLCNVGYTIGWGWDQTGTEGLMLNLYRVGLVLAGGRRSIVRFLEQHGDRPLITAKCPPLAVATYRKHQIIGKDMTCIKIVASGDISKNDPDQYQQLKVGGTGTSLQLRDLQSGKHGGSYDYRVKPQDLAAALKTHFGV